MSYLSIHEECNIRQEERGRKKEMNVKDIIKENSKTKQNECIRYEEREYERKEKNNCPCSFNKGISKHEIPFFLVCSSSIDSK